MFEYYRIVTHNNPVTIIYYKQIKVVLTLTRLQIIKQYVGYDVIGGAIETPR